MDKLQHFDADNFVSVPNYDTKYTSKSLQNLEKYIDTKITGLTWDDIFDNEDTISKELRPILDDIYKEWYDPYISNALKNYDKEIVGKIRASNIDTVYDYMFPMTYSGKYNMSFDKLRDIVIESAQYDASNTIEKYLRLKDIKDTYIYDSPYTNPFWNKLAHTNEANDILLRNIKDAKINDIGIEQVIRANAVAHKNDMVSHGLLAYGYKHNSDAMSQLRQNLHSALTNKDIELCLTQANFKLGPVGITGRANITAFSPVDIMSIPRGDGTRRVRYGYENDFLSLSKLSTYGEYFGTNFVPESMWVATSFYKDNQTDIQELARKYNIKYLDIIGDEYNAKAELFASASKKVTRIEVDMNSSSKRKYKAGRAPRLKQQNLSAITPLEVIIQYGPYSDEFYKSRGRNPDIARQEVRDFYKSKNLELPEELKKYFPGDTKIKPKKYKPTKAPKIKTKSNTNLVDNVESIKKYKYKTTKAPKFKTSNIKRNPVSQPAKHTRPNKSPKIVNAKINKPKPAKLPTKKIGGKGALAIGLTIGTVVGIAATSKNNSKKSKPRKEEKTSAATVSYNSISNNTIDNSYAMQMAQDISSYRYGKHMTGFVNY